MAVHKHAYTIRTCYVRNAKATSGKERLWWAFVRKHAMLLWSTSQLVGKRIPMSFVPNTLADWWLTARFFFFACQRGWWCTMYTPTPCLENWPNNFEAKKKVTESPPPTPAGKWFGPRIFFFFNPPPPLWIQIFFFCLSERLVMYDVYPNSVSGKLTQQFWGQKKSDGVPPPPQPLRENGSVQEFFFFSPPPPLWIQIFFFFLLVREVGDVRCIPQLRVWKIDPTILRPKKKWRSPPPPQPLRENGSVQEFLYLGTFWRT